MTASHDRFEPGALTAPVVDYEPPPFDLVGQPPCPSPAVLHRAPRPPRPVERAAPHVAAPAAPPPAAAKFADAALRRVLEVIDRRRPIAQLRPLLTPAVLDIVFTLTRTGGDDKAAMLRRVRLRTAAVDEREPIAAEVFATYSRGCRVRAIAGRIEACEGRWRMVALHVG
ncbi:Rv3235 family protein [Mycobacterium sp. 1274761.0]|uniref:Rv3235 family protein n=1 Tax=Mycobacterium sp. 1274761.0 TaxID=1834077 RepID=UPI000B2008CD|nr:Rv3235 family protein [Mycobacterium sp. 1274761.0]